ncbi:MAG TPA: AAA family ATPase [Caulobacter sp.]|nr:AAA family ATPase [Caulobacter sp.]
MRHILTGAPGAGKTIILRGLEQAGLAVIEEAATDLIAWRQAQGVAEPWAHPAFTDDILSLQLARQARAGPGPVIFDRSPVCTLTLARFLGHQASPALIAAAEAARDAYAREVFFVEGLDFIVNTDARRIELDSARRFGDLHRETYGSLGFGLVDIAPAAPVDRVRAVLARLT